MDKTIEVAPLVVFIKPYIDLIVQSAVGLAFLYAAAMVQKITGVKVSQTALEKIKSAAATQAGILVAQAEDNLATKVITTDHPSVVNAAQWIMKNLPDAAKEVGATPEALQAIIVGEVGKLQAGGTLSVAQ